jgi:gliding motility-associated-like protein
MFFYVLKKILLFISKKATQFSSIASIFVTSLMKKKSIYLFLLLFMHISYTYAQQIVTDNTQQPNALIQDLIGTNCATASNVSSAINGNSNNIISYGAFNSGTSNFPLQSGLVLSTGNVTSAGNALNTQDLSEGNIDWATDADIETILEIGQTLNATSIEFDFESVNNFVSFKYLFASDEYQQDFPCNFKDVFAILIKRAGTADPYVNIALIPNITTEISTNTIHPNIAGFCDAQNVDYFGGYNFGDTNFNGRTKVLTAGAEIIPNETYHIKMVIADHIDQRFDSAVFIEAEGFGGAIDLGPDQSICGNDITLDADINNPNAIYTWFLNGTQIVGENNSTLQVNQSGSYNARVLIPNATVSCILEDTIEVNIIPFQPVAPIEELLICDSTPSDGVYDFDFPLLKNDEILSELPSTNYTISYHLSQDDAQNNINPIVGIYQNTAIEETIFVRIESLDGSCLQLGSFSLIVNDSPSTQDFTADVCNNALTDSGFTSLTQLNNTMSNLELDRSVTYYNNEADAINQINPIDDFPDFSTQPPFTVARVEASNTSNGCFSLAYVNYNYLEPPFLFVNRFFADACIDPLYEEVEDNTLITYNNLPVTFNIEAYIETLENVTFPGSSLRPLELYGLGNPRSLTLTNSPSFTLRFGVSFENGNCYSEIEIEVHKNYLYNEIGDEKTINRCDDASNDGIEDFSFEEMRTEILDGLNTDYSPVLVLEYYVTEEDRENAMNEIDQTAPITVNNTQTVFIRASYESNTTGSCSIFSQINLNINPTLNLEPVTINYCGNTNPDTNTTNIILEPISETLENDLGIVGNIEYYLTEDDAENQNNEIINYIDLGEGQELFVRVQNIFTGCYTITTVQFNITTVIEASNPQPMIICDDDLDLSATINLESVLDDLPNDSDDITYTFHESFDDAFENQLPIANPSNYTTTTKAIFLRAEIELQNCFTILSFEVLIYADPDLTAISDIINCVVDTNNPFDFLFQDNDIQIINNQLDMQVLYFETEDDAINRIDSIDKNAPYLPIANPQTIFVRLENEIENSCFKVAPMQIEVRQAPIYTIPTDIFECDSNQTDFSTTNLNVKIAEITAGSPADLNISFHLSPLNADLDTNEIPLNFTATSNPQLIYVRIENESSGCYETQSFLLNTLSLPEVLLEQSLSQCGNNYNFNQTWDLTEIELEVLEGRQYNIEFSYFESEADVITDNNPIVNPEVYVNTSDSQTIYAKIRNATTGCFNYVPFDLIINSPPQINDFETYDICENSENSVDLSEINLILLDNTFNKLVSYYANEADAEAEENPLNSIYFYTNTTETLVARVEYSTTNCYAVFPFQLVVNSIPIANQPNDLMACDDDFDGILEFDLTQQNSTILGNQSPNEFSISYYNSETNAINDIQPINTNYVAFNNETIFVRLENNITRCYAIRKFSTIVNVLPFAPIADQVICLNDLPLVVSAETNNPLDTYSWSTNSTSPETEIFEIGSYSVTITNQYGCENTIILNITESETATIEVIETIDFSDPNNITVTINGVGDYLYQLNNGSLQTSNVFQNVPIGYNTITIVDQNGCAQITREVLIIDTPKHMTPNNDGDYDTWHIVGAETLTGTVIYIFDRYGKLLKQLNHNSPGWDGTYNGNDMPTGDYWYIAKVMQNGLSFDVKGHFTLRR